MRSQQSSVPFALSDVGCHWPAVSGYLDTTWLTSIPHTESSRAGTAVPKQGECPRDRATHAAAEIDVSDLKGLAAACCPVVTWSYPFPHVLQWALATSRLHCEDHPPQPVAKRPGALTLPPAGEVEQVFGWFEFRVHGGRKMKKPQDQSSLTSQFFVRKVFWDRGSGHSQPMVLLGILKETQERSGGVERWKTSQISDPGCESVDFTTL